MMEDGVSGAFDRTAANGVTRSAESSVTHTPLIRTEVFGRFLDDGRPSRRLQIQARQLGDHSGDLVIPQVVQLPFGPRFGRGGLCAISGIGNGPEMARRMRPVDDLGHAREVQIGKALDPQGAVIDRTALRALSQPPTQPFGILMQRHRIGIP